VKPISLPGGAITPGLLGTCGVGVAAWHPGPWTVAIMLISLVPATIYIWGVTADVRSRARIRRNGCTGEAIDKALTAYCEMVWAGSLITTQWPAPASVPPDEPKSPGGGKHRGRRSRGVLAVSGRCWIRTNGG
jgi:hypothetical protein